MSVRPGGGDAGCNRISGSRSLASCAALQVRAQEGRVVLSSEPEPASQKPRVAIKEAGGSSFATFPSPWAPKDSCEGGSPLYSLLVCFHCANIQNAAWVLSFTASQKRSWICGSCSHLLEIVCISLQPDGLLIYGADDVCPGT